MKPFDRLGELAKDPPSPLSRFSPPLRGGEKRERGGEKQGNWPFASSPNGFTRQMNWRGSLADGSTACSRADRAQLRLRIATSRPAGGQSQRAISRTTRMAGSARSYQKREGGKTAAWVGSASRFWYPPSSIPPLFADEAARQYSSQVHRCGVCHCRPPGRQCVVRDSCPRTHMRNEACTVERNARQWHTDSLLSCHPACHVWLKRDRLSMDSTIVLG